VILISDIEIDRVSRNYEAQVALFDHLNGHFYDSGEPIEVLASHLDIEVSEMADWLAGQTDLTLSEVRYLANALGVVIEYRVGRLVS